MVYYSRHYSLTIDLPGHDRMVVGFIATYAISAYHHWSCEFEFHSWWCVLYTTLCDKACQWLATGRWLSQGTPVPSTNKANHHEITEILLKVVLNTITLTLTHKTLFSFQWLCEIFIDIVCDACGWK